MELKNHKKLKTRIGHGKAAYKTNTGKSYPLGATVYPNGVNFSIFSKNSEKVELCLFHDVDDATPFQVIPLDATKNKSFYYWHVFVKDLKPDALYGYKVYGEYNPSKGHRFDGSKLLLDPYARAVVKGENYSRTAATLPGDNTPYAMKGVVIDPYTYDWEADEPLNHPYAKSIIYELHVKGFTQHPNSGIEEGMRGTYTGLVEKIPYLKDLGITTVELMPVFQFDETEAHSPLLKNYWGYSPLAFFAQRREPGRAGFLIQGTGKFILLHPRRQPGIFCRFQRMWEYAQYQPIYRQAADNRFPEKMGNRDARRWFSL